MPIYTQEVHMNQKLKDAILARMPTAIIQKAGQYAWTDPNGYINTGYDIRLKFPDGQITSCTFQPEEFMDIPSMMDKLEKSIHMPSPPLDLSAAAAIFKDLYGSFI